MNIRTFLVRLLALATSLSIAHTIIHMMVDEIVRGTFVFTQFFGYFTVQAGSLTALVLFITAIAPPSLLHSIILDYLRGAVTLYMVITIIVYHLLESPPGTWKLDDWSTVHVYAPIVSLLMWFVFLPPVRLHMREWWVLSWMIYPLGFALASVARGLHDGWYPYGFLNVTKNGSEYVTNMVLGLTIGVVILGSILLVQSFIKRQFVVKSEVEVF